MAERGYLKSKTIHLSPTDGKICLTASIVSCKGFFFVKCHLSICKVTQKRLIKIL